MTDGLIIQEMKNRPGQNNREIHDNRKDNKKMKELYEAIEAKIKASGYPRAISGEDVYNDICDQIDGKENGSYVLLSKFEDDVIFEYHITIQDEKNGDKELTISRKACLRQILMRNKGGISDDRKSEMRGKTFHFAFLKFRKILIDVSF